MNWRNHSSFSLPQASMSVKSSAPHSTAHTATASNSARSWRTWRALRGSEIDTNTRISGVTAPAFMGTPKRQKTTQFMPL